MFPDLVDILYVYTLGGKVHEMLVGPGPSVWLLSPWS